MCLKISTTSGEAGWFSHSLLLFMPIIINFPFFSYWLKAVGHHLHLTKATYPLVLCYSYLYSLNLHDIELFLYSPDKCHYSLNILLLLFTCWVLSDSLWFHGLQQGRLLCPSLSPGDCSVMYIASVMLSNHLILCCPLLLLPSIFTNIRVFSNEPVLHIRRPKYWNFSFRISPSNDIQGWFPLGSNSLITLQFKRLLRIFPNTAFQNHKFFNAQSSVWSKS